MLRLHTMSEFSFESEESEPTPFSGKSLAGKFLLASSALLDPNFERSIVLIVQHNEEGALGLIVNRPMKASLKEVCSDACDPPVVCAREGPVYHGGPCEGVMMVLHARAMDAQINVVDGVYFTMDVAAIESLMLAPDVPMKVFVGHAGWTAGQLEAEIATGSWLIVPADSDQVFFDGSGKDQWTKLTRNATLGRWIDPGRIPDDPNMN